MLRSMTAFISDVFSLSETSKYPSADITYEIKGLNNKFLDISFKSNFLDSQSEMFIRKQVQKVIRRGSIEVKVNMNTTSDNVFVIDTKKVQEIQNAVNKSPLSKLLTFGQIKDLPGIVNEKPSRTLSKKDLNHQFKATLSQFIQLKSEEGSKIQKIFNKKLQQIQKLLNKMESGLKADLQKRRKLHLDKMKSLKVDLTADELKLEALNYVEKIDIAEEIERMAFHLSQLKKDFTQEISNGKKIDFVILEMLREINTILAKVSSVTLKELGLSIKILIEEMREQVQNVE